MRRPGTKHKLWTGRDGLQRTCRIGTRREVLTTMNLAAQLTAEAPGRRGDDRGGGDFHRRAAPRRPGLLDGSTGPGRGHRVRPLQPGLPGTPRSRQPAVAEPRGDESHPREGRGLAAVRRGGRSGSAAPASRTECPRPDGRHPGSNRPLLYPPPPGPMSGITTGTGRPRAREILEAVEAEIADGLAGIAGLTVIDQGDFAAYPVDDYHDARRDDLGHIPYTPLFFAALGTILARKDPRPHVSPAQGDRPGLRQHPLEGRRRRGRGHGDRDPDPVPGAAGIHGPESWRPGFLLCLCSKNDEPDVLEVFDRRPDMVLKREHLVSWRVNWQPKSENIRSLAQELNLGLDSFIFLDDNPVECAEVRAGCPEVLTLRLPVDGDIDAVPRPRLGIRPAAGDRGGPAADGDVQGGSRAGPVPEAGADHRRVPGGAGAAGRDRASRVPSRSPASRSSRSGPTSSTSRPSAATRARSAGSAESGLECRVVEVSDRFGDYGLVGVVIFGARRGRPRGRHLPAELPRAGPGRRAPDAQRARGDRPATGAVARWTRP